MKKISRVTATDSVSDAQSSAFEIKTARSGGHVGPFSFYTFHSKPSASSGERWLQVSCLGVFVYFFLSTNALFISLNGFVLDRRECISKLYVAARGQTNKSEPRAGLE